MPAVLALAGALAAWPAVAQTTSQQAGRPQPPPAPKTAPQTSGAPGTAAAQAGATKPGNTGAAGQAQAGGSKQGGSPTAKPAKPAPQPAGGKPAAKKKPAPPQTSKIWKGRGFAVVSGGAQIAAPGYTSTATFKVHAEDATLNSDASIGVGPAFGARAGWRVRKNLAVGGGFEFAATGQTLDVTGRLPHPFQFNQYREVAGTASGLDRREMLVAFELSWLVALTRRVDMFVFGGPAYINVRQDMATRIKFTESYPYDAATLTGVETASVSGGGFGVTAGADVSYLLTKHVGIGGEARYSYASATLTPADQPSKVGLGGLQATFCARFLF
jgi:hypothetical protein